MCACALSVAPAPLRLAVSVYGRSGDSLPLRLLVPLQLPQGPAGALHTASLPCGSGQWNSCISLQHCPGAVGSGSPATCCRIALRQWAQDLLLLTVTLPGGSGQWKSCRYTAALPWGSGQWYSRNTMLHCPRGSGQRAVDVMPGTASLPAGSGKWISCGTLPHCLWSVGGGTPSVHYLIACRQWVVELLNSSVWCGVVCCVVWCGVPKALLPDGNGRDVLLTGIAKRVGACACACSVWRACTAAGRVPARSGPSLGPP